LRGGAPGQLALCGHALAGTYSVLTRLPGDARLQPVAAARLLQARFASPFLLGEGTSADLPGVLARLGVTGVRSTTPSCRGVYRAVGVAVVTVPSR